MKIEKCRHCGEEPVVQSSESTARGLGSFWVECGGECLCWSSPLISTRKEAIEEWNKAMSAWTRYGKAYKDGYRDATKVIEEKNKENAAQARRDGYQEGYQVGYEEGYKTAKDNAVQLHDMSEQQIRDVFKKKGIKRDVVFMEEENFRGINDLMPNHIDKNSDSQAEKLFQLTCAAMKHCHYPGNDPKKLAKLAVEHAMATLCELEKIAQRI